jgi:NAD(P)H dehydrogenase (quinone)
MNRRELLRDVGVATAAASLVGSAQAQGPISGVNVLIAYYSVTGNTEKMAQGVAEGAKTVSGTNVVLKAGGRGYCR